MKDQRRYPSIGFNNLHWKVLCAILFGALCLTILNCHFSSSPAPTPSILASSHVPPSLDRESERISIESKSENETRYLEYILKKLKYDASGFPIYPPEMKRQLIFCITPGQTGTSWLSEILSAVAHSQAFHERAPALLDFPSLLRTGKKATFGTRYVAKIPAIEKDLEQELISQFPILHPPSGLPMTQRYYGDISQMFLKSQGDVLMSRFYEDPNYEINIIILRRYLPDTLKQWLSVPRIPWTSKVFPEHYSGGEYSTSHRDFAIMRPIKDYFQQDTVELILGYLLDYEVQTFEFKIRWPKVRFLDLRSEDMFALGPELASFWRKMAMVPYPPAVQRLNLRMPRSLKGNFDPSIFFTDEITSEEVLDKVLLARTLKFIDDCKTMGQVVPELPHLVPLVSCPSDKNPRKVCEKPRVVMTKEEIEQYSKIDIPLNAPPSSPPTKS